MLEPEEVDEGYFTPVVSTSLASIFKNDPGIDEPVNSSLKYKPLQPKKTEPSPKAGDPNASHCVFSCSVIAYEWLKGAHKCKGKVGFAVLRMINSGICKIILYSPDKSTLFCTTLSHELQVTLKGPMIITLYDDDKKYWGLCFNPKVIDKVKEILQQENVVIKDYDESQEVNNSVPAKPEDKDRHTDEVDTENINFLETPALKNDKASILTRIANVGHAILPSTPASPVKKSTPADKNPLTETLGSTDKFSVISDRNETSSTKAAKELTRSIAIQASENNHEVNNSMVSNNVKLVTQGPLPSLPIDYNQVSAGVNGHMMLMHKLVSIITNPECGISASEIGVVINKLTHLQGLVKTMEIFETLVKGNNQGCPCKDKVEIDSTDNAEDQNRQNFAKISTLEELIREKDNVILKLQSELQIERMKNSDLLKEDNRFTKCLQQEVEDLKQDLIVKDEEIKNMIPRSEADIIIANTLKKLMNDTFRSLASNFESDCSYSGSQVKGIVASVIKKNTVESLNSVLPNRNASYVSSEPTD